MDTQPPVPWHRPGFTAAAVEVERRMGKRLLIQLLYPWLRLYWWLVRPKTFGAHCVIHHEGALLLVRNTYGRRQWAFPGGGIARGEAAEDAVRREVREEVGLHLQELTPLGAFTATIDYRRAHVAVFAGTAPDRRVTTDPGEILEARWCQPHDLPPLAPVAARMLAMWQRAQR
jgi:ADP-ribose pyrophosphatase YjhB (NUDIX family)